MPPTTHVNTNGLKCMDILCQLHTLSIASADIGTAWAHRPPVLVLFPCVEI